MSERFISSLHNQRIKDAIKLRNSRQRSKRGRTLVDGVREVSRALDGGVLLLDAFVCDELFRDDGRKQLLTNLANAGTHVWQVTPEVFSRLAFGERQEGLVAVAEFPRRSLESCRVPPGGLVDILHGLEKPGNVGAILRTADAAGLSAVFVTDARTDLYNPNCIRASLGTVFTQTVCDAPATDVLAWLRERRSKIYAARVDAAHCYTEVDYTGDAAIVLGSEAAGLSDEWHATDVTPVKLPMLGTADSLNVSAAAAVLFYEALRQRRSA
jgi:TrmH family RNA methyltransferase